MPAKESDQKFLLRVDKPLFQFFKELATKDERSINYEIMVAMRERKERIEKEQSPSIPA